jgi:3-oxoacyl-[acyl-carrier protein] reductase
MASDRILVVGGSAGIGAALAAAFGERSVVWSRRGGVDACDPDSVARASRAFLEKHGAPFGLVHCVGDFLEQPLLQTDHASFDALLSSNLTSACVVARALVPAMVAARRGRVLWFSAAGADEPGARTRAPVYFGAKAALVSLARSLAKEVAASGVTVNVLAPGLIDHPQSHHESQQRLLPRVPTGRIGTPSDLVGAARWLLSDEASYVTGAVITIDGGLSL